VGEDGSVSYPLRDAGYKMNDLIGRSGLEAVYEDRLRGQDGSLQVVKDSDGVIQSSQVVEKPQAATKTA